MKEPFFLITISALFKFKKRHPGMLECGVKVTGNFAKVLKVL